MAQLEADKRRGERLLLLTRQGAQRPDEVGSGPSEKEPGVCELDETVGANRSRVSPKKGLTPSTSVPSSTPTPDGESGA